MADLTIFNMYMNTLRELTVRVVFFMPEDKIDYRPAPNSRTFAEITRHILDVHSRCWSAVTEKTGRTFPADKFVTRDDLVTALHQTQEQVNAEMEGVTDEHLDRLVKSPFGGNMVPAHSFLSLMMIHESEHKGNLVIIAKICGIDPPDVMALRAEREAAAAAK